MAEITRPLIDENRILKEIHNTDDIEVKTELNSIQIESINKAQTLSFLFGSAILDQHLNNFMRLQKSKDRKSMGEFIEGMKSKKDDLIKKAKNFTFMG